MGWWADGLVSRYAKRIADLGAERVNIIVNICSFIIGGRREGTLALPYGWCERLLEDAFQALEEAVYGLFCALGREGVGEAYPVLACV